MIAARLSSVWQVAGVAAAALCCYLVSQSVAAERASLARVDRKIASAREDIAKLETEIGTRARMTQLDSWNGTFGLKAPRPAQFVESGVQLASLYGRRGQPALTLDPAIAGQQGSPQRVAFRAPAPVAAPPPVVVSTPAPLAPATPPQQQPLLRAATYVRMKSDRSSDDATTPVTRAAYHEDAPVKAPVSLLPADIAQLADAEASGAAKPAKPKPSAKKASGAER